MSTKIVLAFSVFVVFAILILVVSLLNLRRVDGMVRHVATVSAPRVVASGEIVAALNRAELAQRDILLQTGQKEREGIASSLDEIRGGIARGFDRLAALMPPESQGEMAGLRKAWDELDAVNRQISGMALQNTAAQARALTLGESNRAFADCIGILNEITDMLSKSSAFAAQPTLARAVALRAGVYALQNIERGAVLEVAQANIDALVAEAHKLIARLDPEAAFLVRGERLPGAIREKCARFGDYYAKVRATCLMTLEKARMNQDQKAFTLAETLGREKGMRVRGLVSAVAGAAEKEFAEQTRLSEDAVQSSVFWQILISCAGLILPIALLCVVLRGVTRGLGGVITQLTLSAQRVNRAAHAISTSSERLAEGARLQADQLRDTAGTLGGMASMTRRNADTASKTEATTATTVKQVESGSVAVRDMSAAMADIDSQSERIQAIIKTIEEIAFQTNLLALNAAVEAARAGEAGKGFAIVADEVRSLAQRSAQAAHDTSDLIVATVDKVRKGASIAARLAESFQTIEDGTNQFQAHIREISLASGEQAHGVEQANANIAQLDSSTRENAKYAEQSSEASRDLKAQAALLSGMVDDLNRLVRGGGSVVPPPKPPSGGAFRPRRAAAPAAASSAASSADSSAASAPDMSAPGAAKGKPRVVSPEMVIPLDEEF